MSISAEQTIPKLGDLKQAFYLLLNVCVLGSAWWIFGFSHLGSLNMAKITCALTRSWMVSTDFFSMSGGWWWLLADLESSVAESFFNIEARFQKHKERGRSSICSVCFIFCWLKQGRWPKPELLWEGPCQAIDTGRHG